MIKKAIVSLMLLGIAGQSQAAGNTSAGQEKSAMCQGCHGVDGNSVAPTFPSLAGQHPQYIVKQLSDFQSGKRKNETMEPMAAALTPQDMEDLAAYFSSQKLQPPTVTADKKTIENGKAIYKGGIKDKGVAACASCHGPNAEGNGPARFPALASQQADYIVAQIELFHHETRNNDMNKMMRIGAFKVNTDEAQQVAAYLASIKR